MPWIMKLRLSGNAPVAGKATGDKRSKTIKKMDQAVGSVKQGLADAKDKVGDLVDEAKDKVGT